MASVEQCRAALEHLSSHLASVDEETRRRHSWSGTVSCSITDLDVVFCGRLKDAHLLDITTEKRPKAQVRLAMQSDLLLALAAGETHLGTAWANGDVRIEAGIRELLRLRSFL